VSVFLLLNGGGGGIQLFPDFNLELLDALAEDELLPVFSQLAYCLSRLGVFDDRANGYVNVNILAVLAVPRVAASLSSCFSEDVLPVFEMDQSPEVRVGARAPMISIALSATSSVNMMQSLQYFPLSARTLSVSVSIMMLNFSGCRELFHSSFLDIYPCGDAFFPGCGKTSAPCKPLSLYACYALRTIVRCVG
jgi:hypothetical protein